MRKEKMEPTVIAEVGKLIGKTEGEVWQLVHSGFLVIDVAPSYRDKGKTNSISITLGKETNASR